MKYIVCEQPGSFAMKEKEPPIPREGEALVRIRRVGICGTDLHAFEGTQAYFSYPRILGHELAAEVVEVKGNQAGINPGDPVVIMPYENCGTCIACKHGKTNCCSTLNVLGVHVDGGMQEYYRLPSRLLLPAPGLSLSEMALVEPLAIGGHAIRRAAIQAGEFVLVIGCGPIGIGTIRMAQLAGAEVIAMDLNQDRLRYCQDVLGVSHIVQAADDPLHTIQQITNQDLPTAVFDVTGSKKALEQGIQYMAPGGRYVFIGLTKGELTFSHPYIHARESSLLCSRNATQEDMEAIIQMLQEGKFPSSEYITHTVHFSEMMEQFGSWLQPETQVIKAMTVWE
ncbi:MAG: zinc-binding alcohol dehydrogenase family protein [Bacteroidota bacterium]